MPSPRRKEFALQRYLQRYIEQGLPDAPVGAARWQHVLVIPAYDESPELLQTLSQLVADGRLLIIVVLNRPDSDPNSQVNSALREAINNLDGSDITSQKPGFIYPLNSSTDLFCYDLELRSGPSPAAQGVGLARKLGCDIALLWQNQGAISSDWICSSDADAILPRDYFSRLELAINSVAAVYPFVHTPGTSEDINRATALYEIRLHHYVLGLSYARSPYAYHTLGSCIAVKGLPYAQVRGYPKRSGGEDFYLLNKLAKLGPIASLSGDCITLQSRASHRVPFGTGPAVGKIIEDKQALDSVLFYHPRCFEALKNLLLVLPQLREHDAPELPELLINKALDEKLARAATAVLCSMGLDKAVSHCRKHGVSEAQFIRQFHQWFDGFKTLKFIHGLRDAGWPMQSLPGLLDLQPTLFPAGMAADRGIASVRATILDHWQWTIGNQHSNSTATAETAGYRTTAPRFE